MFCVPKPKSDRAERICSALAFVLVLATWVVAYVAIAPANPLPYRTHIATVRP